MTRALKVSLHVSVRYLTHKGIFWQAIAPGSRIDVYAYSQNGRHFMSCKLSVGDIALAGTMLEFKTRAGLIAAMKRAEETNDMEPIQGECKLSCENPTT